ncbi:K(+)-transporting ATPase subunit C [Ignavigranum ruoffiae]|uniref:K(+)-transporting ATPase subunit C n=1 Tax=Ignavigranum ruoffiae TaxID=89093 RepID=UPI0024AE4B5D|nr:K(+)-transporting ATPase subunit C [Ignavigranum ruoffiae]
MKVKQLSFWQDLSQGFRLTLVMLVLCGFIFPMILTGLSAMLFPSQAKGSLVEFDGQHVGAKNVGQEFHQDYFLWSRPSAYHYNVYREDSAGNQTYLDGSEFAGLASGSDNYAPSNPALADRVKQDMQIFLAKNPGVNADDFPTFLMTASGSGLDPHISKAAAEIQVDRIAKASGLDKSSIEKIIQKHTQGKLLSILGEETVNVLLVNIDIAKAMQN